MTSEEMVANVERGITWLNFRFPGWVEKIDLDTLDLNNNSCCVLGQLFGDSMCIHLIYGYKEEGKTWADKHAFDIQTGLFCDEAYAELTEIWKQKILDTRS